MMRYLNIALVYLLFISITGCSGCSQSGRRVSATKKDRVSDSKDHGVLVSDGSRTVVRMVKSGGVYEIPVEINGVPMHFIFDTGASSISISGAEALFLYKQGKLSDEDVVGKQNFIDATGRVSEGTVIKLHSVKLGNKTLYNVSASVVHNMEAPLLFGQSALERFGKISIDYNKGIIIFE
ncbi:retropepsin-like aspartic protease [uncultured Pontibacter sp.]|uniref:retropepsin-like aspartic protease family protein n=1 Tax=uncultured Pontibacter sp. TaxID=453356 RepID=UPI002626FE58|nr:retropepsin-like aspartic protease [uncultured Pontibacter sp.]